MRLDAHECTHATCNVFECYRIASHARLCAGCLGQQSRQELQGKLKAAAVNELTSSPQKDEVPLRAHYQSDQAQVDGHLVPCVNVTRMHYNALRMHLNAIESYQNVSFVNGFRMHMYTQRIVLNAFLWLRISQVPHCMYGLECI